MTKAFLLLFTLIFMPLLAGAEPTKDQLIGHWRHADKVITVEYTFKEDGTFAGQLSENGKVVWTFAGKWSLSGDSLNYEYTKSNFEKAPPGTKDQDKLVEVTKEHYIIKARDGANRKYTRVTK